ALPDPPSPDHALALVDQRGGARSRDRALCARGARCAPGGLLARRDIPALAIRMGRPVAEELERVGLGWLRDARRRRRRDCERGAGSPLTRVELHDATLRRPDAGPAPDRCGRVDDVDWRAG